MQVEAAEDVTGFGGAWIETDEGEKEPDTGEREPLDDGVAHHDDDRCQPPDRQHQELRRSDGEDDRPHRRDEQ